MKYAVLFLTVFLLGLFACNQPSTDNQMLQARIDSLEKKLPDTYKPGFGEFMSGIQVHHAKLWFAGLHQNWQLADFEINEIQESITAIQKYCTNRPETKSITMIDQPLDSITNAIKQKDLVKFRSSYVLLTNTCNSCHQATNHAFNVITIPENPPFSNQKFNVPETKH